MLKHLVWILCLLPAFCLAHDDFTKGSKDREHLSGDDLKGYLHGHSESVRNAPGSNKWHTQTGFWDYDPDVDDANEKTAENWEASGCVKTDADGNKIYDHDCYNKFIKDGGLTPTEPTPEQPIDPIKPKPKPPIEDERQPPIVEGKGEMLDDTTLDASLPQRQRQFPDDYSHASPCIFTSESVEGLQVVEYMTNLKHTDTDEEGNVFFEEIHPQWIEVLNTTDAVINLKDAVLKYTQADELTGVVEIETDFNIGANSVGIIATLPPSYYRVWYDDGGDEVIKTEFAPNINGAPYHYFRDAYDHDIDLAKRWTLEYNGKIVFDLSTVDVKAYYNSEPCQVLSKNYSKGILYYSRVKKHSAIFYTDATPGFYEKPDAPAAPSARRTVATTWAKLKTRR